MKKIYLLFCILSIASFNNANAQDIGALLTQVVGGLGGAGANTSGGSSASAADPLTSIMGLITGNNGQASGEAGKCQQYAQTCNADPTANSQYCDAYNQANCDQVLSQAQSGQSGAGAIIGQILPLVTGLIGGGATGGSSGSSGNASANPLEGIMQMFGGAR